MVFAGLLLAVLGLLLWGGGRSETSRLRGAVNAVSIESPESVAKLAGLLGDASIDGNAFVRTAYEVSEDVPQKMGILRAFLLANSQKHLDFVLDQFENETMMTKLRFGEFLCQGCLSKADRKHLMDTVRADNGRVRDVVVWFLAYVSDDKEALEFALKLLHESEDLKDQVRAIQLVAIAARYNGDSSVAEDLLPYLDSPIELIAVGALTQIPGDESLVYLQKHFENNPDVTEEAKKIYLDGWQRLHAEEPERTAPGWRR